MSRLARAVLYSMVLGLCVVALTTMSMAQQATKDSQGRSITTLPGQPNHRFIPPPGPAIPEGTVTIFSNLNLSYSYDCCAGWTESGPTSGVGTFLQAMAFKPTKGTYLLTQLDLAISYVLGTNGYTLELREDNRGKPGRKIASWQVTGLPVFGASDIGLETIKVTQHIELECDHQYWLVPIVNSDEWTAWNVNNLSPQNVGKGAYSNDGGATWTTFDTSTNGHAAFDVLGWVLYSVSYDDRR